MDTVDSASTSFQEQEYAGAAMVFAGIAFFVIMQRQRLAQKTSDPDNYQRWPANRAHRDVEIPSRHPDDDEIDAIQNVKGSFSWFVVLDAISSMICVMQVKYADDSGTTVLLMTPSHGWMVLAFFFLVDSVLGIRNWFCLAGLGDPHASQDVHEQLEELHWWAVFSFFMHVLTTVLWLYFHTALADSAAQEVAIAFALAVRLFKLRPLWGTCQAASCDSWEDALETLKKHFSTSKRGSCVLRLMCGVLLLGVLGLGGLLMAAAISDATDDVQLPVSAPHAKVGVVYNSTGMASVTVPTLLASQGSPSNFAPVMLDQERVQGDIKWYCSDSCPTSYVAKHKVNHLVARTAAGAVGGTYAGGMFGCAIAGAVTDGFGWFYCAGGAIYGAIGGGVTSYAINSHGDECIGVCEAQVPRVVHDSLDCVPYLDDCRR